MDLHLNERVVLLTGSSSGIGRATAVAFGQAEAKVAVTYLNDHEGAEQTAREVNGAGGEAAVFRYDLNDPVLIRDMAEKVGQAWGRIDVLVNNAVAWPGSGPGGASFEDVPADVWQGTFRSLLEGVYATIQAVMPWMRRGEWGRIVSISSSLAEDGLPGAGAYAAAKAGLHGLTRVLAKELGPAGILTNAVMPGITLTERARRTLPVEVQREVAEATPTGRLTEPHEVASLITYLGSGANGHVNGEIIRVTGGL